MQTRNQTIIPLTQLDIQRMVFEVVRRLRAPLDEDRKPNGYWNYERCYDEAKKYKSKNDFKHNGGTAYSVALKNGWIKDYDWFEEKHKPSGYWDSYEHCYDEAKKYKSRSEFANKKHTIYNIARKNGWLEDYTWFEEKRKPVGHWTRERCYDEAKKYNSKSEFKEKSSSAFNVALKNGWLDDYTWLKRPENWNKKWSYETCFEEAKKYKTRSQFEKNSNGAYSAAKKSGWLDDYTWFERPQKPSGYWDKERCYDEAKKCKTQAEFRQLYPTAANVARKNGWLSDYTWFEKGRISEKNIYVVYYYEDKETNAVYVGLTNNLKRRHKQHRDGMFRHGEIRYDIVYKYWHNTLGKEVPEPIVLHKDIYAKDAQEYEKKYVEQFKNEGKLVLNIAKAGSLGAFGKWTKEKCYDEAKKYKTTTEFSKSNETAYNVARKNGWLDDYTWLTRTRKPVGYWNRETCYEKAKEYKSRSEFANKCPAAYSLARKNGWLANYTWFEKLTRYWNYETCYNEAKKYKTRTEFQKKQPGAYTVALKNGWINDYNWFLEPTNAQKWNRETCYELAKSCNSRKELELKSKRAYDLARNNGWLDDYTWLAPSATGKKWNRETCFNEAKKYKSKAEFRKLSSGAYSTALKNGWLNDYTWFQRPEHWRKKAKATPNQAAL